MMEREHRLFKHLGRFFDKDPKRRQIVEELMEKGISKAEIFRQVSQGLGAGKSHASGRREEKLKES